MPDRLTDVQKAYNVAQSEMFAIAAWGHYRYFPRGESLTEEGRRQERDYNDRIRAARDTLEAALLRLVAEHIETLAGSWGIPATYLRSLAANPEELCLLAAPAEEEDEENTAAAPPALPAEHGAAFDLIRAEVVRLGLMVDEYAAGASALSDKLRRARDLHRQTCPLAQGVLGRPGFTCSMCVVLDAPAAPVSPS